MVSPDVWLAYLTNKQQTDQRDSINLGVYGCLVGAAFIFAIIRAYIFLLASLRCSERLHDKMVVAILQAPLIFFDTNPVGRILNRFSKDVGCMDELLPKKFLISLQLILFLLAAILIPAVANFWVLFVIAPLSLIAVYIVRHYLKSSRELKRLESICRSPVFSHISETLNGLDTIRTRGRQNDFINQFYRYVGVIHETKVISTIAYVSYCIYFSMTCYNCMRYNSGTNLNWGTTAGQPRSQILSSCRPLEGVTTHAVIALQLQLGYQLL